MSTPLRPAHLRLAILVLLAVVVGLLLWVGGEHDQDAAPTAATSADGLNPVARVKIAGRILDAQKNPIQGAFACAVPLPASTMAGAREPRCVSTNDTGEYALDALPPGTFAVSGSAAKHLQTRTGGLIELVAGEGRKGVDVTMTLGGTEIRGRTLDVHRRPVPGAEVLVIGQGAMSNVVSFARSGEDGAFTVWVAPGPVHVMVRAAGYANAPMPFINLSAPLELVLVSQGAVTGRVVRAGTNEPVAFVDVEAIIDPQDTPLELVSRMRRADTFAVSDRQGRFEITRLFPGRYKVQGEGRGLYGQAMSPLLGAGKRAELTIELHPALSVAGRIIVADGKGCRGGGVTLLDAERGQSASAAADSDGIATLRALLPGSYVTARVTCKDHVPGAVYPRIEVSESLQLRVDGKPHSGMLTWPMKLGLKLRGTVVRSDGTPVADAMVTATTSGTAPAPAGWAKTAHDGTFVLGGLEKASYVLNVSRAQGGVLERPMPVAVDDAAAPVRLMLAEAGALQGRVVYSDGTPASNTDVVVQAVGEVRHSKRVSAGTDGRFVLTELPAGAYHLTADGASAATPARVQVGQTTTVRLVAPRQDGEIRGQVMADGQPQPEVIVDVHRQTNSGPAAPLGIDRLALRVVTGPTGEFVIRDLAAVDHHLRASTGLARAEVHAVKPNGAVTLSLKPSASVAGDVVSGDKPVQVFSVNLKSKTGEFHRRERFFHTGGRWLIDDLPDGDYEVTVTAPEGTTSSSLSLAPGESKRDVRLNIVARPSP